MKYQLYADILVTLYIIYISIELEGDVKPLLTAKQYGSVKFDKITLSIDTPDVAYVFYNRNSNESLSI
ncbi:hypothetical protein ABN09_07315 [Morganella morganii]|nr:hypothetical protein ABN09_07315 [Morganella morganii]